jgi:hypothetical protein
MKATGQWITYRTRFLVKAKQLTTSLRFTDVLGRPHSGRKGDYLVETSDGVLRIAPRQIFEDIYVPLMSDSLAESSLAGSSISESSISDQKKRPDSAITGLPKAMLSRNAPNQQRDRRNPTFPLHLTRKSPQSDRSGRNSFSRSRPLGGNSISMTVIVPQADQPS